MVQPWFGNFLGVALCLVLRPSGLRDFLSGVEVSSLVMNGVNVSACSCGIPRADELHSVPPPPWGFSIKWREGSTVTVRIGNECSGQELGVGRR